MSSLFMPERHLLVSVSCLELVCCETDVCFLHVLGLTSYSPSYGHSSFFLPLHFSIHLAVAALFRRRSSIWLCSGHLLIISYKCKSGLLIKSSRLDISELRNYM